MCLGVPAKVIKVKENTAIVDYGGGFQREVDILLQPDVKEGDYVIVHAGAVIAKLKEKEALEILRLINEAIQLSDKPYGQR